MMRFNHLALLSLLAAAPACRQPEAAPSYIDPTAVDSSVRPQDDFFLYANGGWLKRTEIPASQPAWGAIVTLTDQSLGRMHNILDSLSGVSGLKKGSIDQQVADLYASVIDSVGIEAKGLGPLKDDLDKIAAIGDVPGIFAEAAREYAQVGSPLFSFSVSADDKNSSMEAVHFDQGGLGLPNKDYYFNQDTSIQAVREAYKTYMATVFILTGEDSLVATRDASRVMDAEVALAKISKAPVALRDPNANYHRIPVSALPALTGGLPWKDLLRDLEVVQDTVLVGQPEFYKGLYEVLQHLPLEDWKAYLAFHLVDSYVAVLGHKVQDAHFAYAKLLSGQKQPQERWKRACRLVDQQLGDALGQLYVQQYFPPAAKERMRQLVDNLQETYAEHIQSLDWMSDSTKAKALVKLHAIAKKIGYPDKWKD